MNLQHYVPYLREEKCRVYRFINCLPLTYKENIGFDMPKTMDEAIRKSKWHCHLFKQRSEVSKIWQHKKNENLDQCKKGFKPSPFQKRARSHTEKNYNKPISANSNGVKGIRTSNGGWNNNSKHVKCWGCNGPHL